MLCPGLEDFLGGVDRSERRNITNKLKNNKYAKLEIYYPKKLFRCYGKKAKELWHIRLYQGLLIRNDEPESKDRYIGWTVDQVALTSVSSWSEEQVVPIEVVSDEKEEDY